MHVSAWQSITPKMLAGARATRPLPFPLAAPHRRMFYLARSGVAHAARVLLERPGAAALVPDYHNGLEVQALRLAGAEPRFYRVDHRLEPDIEAIRRGLSAGARLVLIIHFNGWPQPVKEIRALCREHGAALIEDCALAFLSERHGAPLGSFGDAAVFCLYKTLPIPHGAVLTAPHGTLAAEIAELPLRSPGALSTAARTADLAIAGIRSGNGAFGSAIGGALASAKRWIGSALSSAGMERAPVGSMVFDERLLDLGMSPWVERMLTRFDYVKIRERRRANYVRLLEWLQDEVSPLLPSLPDGVCPLFFPLLVEDKSEAVRGLAGRGIEAVEFWNRGDPEAVGDHHAEAVELRRRVIELPIHQDVTPEQIDHIARSVLALGLGRRR